MVIERDGERYTIEQFAPVLTEQYSTAFQGLLNKISAAYNGYRRQVIIDEINKYAASVTDDDLDLLRYLACLNTILDLHQQGWVFCIKDEKLYLKLYNDEANDKEHVRYRLRSERMAQFEDASVLRFIERMEQVKKYHNLNISILNLVGDPEIILHNIEHNPTEIVLPYIQLVSNQRDEQTGYRLIDIWRYFRYTWSIPYKSMPGRNLFYLVRDAAQPFHPVIGIFALGNSVLNMTVRDDDIGWTVDSIKRNMQRRTIEEGFTQQISKTNGQKASIKRTRYAESDQDYKARVYSYAEQLMQTLLASLEAAIKDVYVKDLGYYRQTKYPTEEMIASLRAIADDLRDKIIDNKKTPKVDNWELEAKSLLFKKKRALELARVLDAKRIIMSYQGTQTPEDWLKSLLKTDQGRTAIYTALIANRKNKIGSNMMEIIVCGAIPPYNELLGGKLVSILACSSRVIRDYTYKYQDAVSEIASRMKGEKVVRDSRLVYLGTTSLYSVGSSQYNRIKVKQNQEVLLEFKKLGVTEGFGSIYFSKTTTALFSKILQLQDGGKKINHVFGEGTSPRFRMISKGLSTLGIRSEAYLRHYSPRIVYAIELTRNSKEYLMGYTDELEYRFDIQSEEAVSRETETLIDYWYHRWLEPRLINVDIQTRLGQFKRDSILLSKES